MRFVAAVLAAMMPVAVPAAECSARSGPNQAAVVELYTSEGCDSCPPADRWLSALDATRVVPLAFHVDYWDYIGWKDPFASAAYSERQRQGVRISGGRIVYTPQVTLNGRDFGAWRAPTALRDVVAAAALRPAKAELELVATVSGSDLEVRVGASLAGATGDHTVFLALTESRLESAVKAGENRGVTLRHDHVVREFRALGRVAGAARLEAKPRITLARGWKAEDLALVAFVQDANTGAIAQALRLPLCRS